MYARGHESLHTTDLVLIGSVSPRDAALLSGVDVTVLPDDATLPSAFLDRVRSAVSERRTPSRHTRRTISG
jgi:hypothetical protein